MGMDVYGIENKAAYYQHSQWGWKAMLWQVIVPANDLFEVGISQHDLKDWEVNDGHGLKTQAECDRLADAIERFLEQDSREAFADARPAEGSEGATFRLLQGMGVEIVSPSGYMVVRKDVERFVRFLRECGGFRIE
jgi:hypothetical protein